MPVWRTLPTLLPLNPPWLPAAAITNRGAPVVCIASGKGGVLQGEQVSTSR
jgi:hypothetical protein